MPQDPRAIRAALALAATGLLAMVGLRHFLPGAEKLPENAVAFGLALVLAVLASLREPPRLAVPLAAALVLAELVWVAARLGELPAGLALAAGGLALVALARGEPLVVGGLALLLPATRLAAGLDPLAPLALAPVALLGAAARLPAPDDERRRRLVIAVLAAAVVGLLFARHNALASSAPAPDDVLAVALEALLAAAAFVPAAARRARPLLLAAPLLAYAVVGSLLVATTRYHVDAVVAPHRAAELLLAGADPYARFDMREALARFDLPETLATRYEDGGRVTTLNYPAGAFLLVTPFVALGLADVRWVYLVELLLLAAALSLRARRPWGGVLAAALVANVVVLRQYLLAGIDPTWLLLVLLAWHLRARPRASSTLLGLACASRQLAWFFVPFFALEAWRREGAAAAARRTAWALGAFALVQLPFVVWDPRAYAGAVLAPLLEPFEPYGVGLVRLGVLGALPLLPRAAYALASVVAYVAALGAAARLGRRAPAATLSLALVPLFFAWRALQNYFAFVPLLALVGDDELVPAPRIRQRQ